MINIHLFEYMDIEWPYFPIINTYNSWQYNIKSTEDIVHEFMTKSVDDLHHLKYISSSIINDDINVIPNNILYKEIEQYLKLKNTNPTLDFIVDNLMHLNPFIHCTLDFNIDVNNLVILFTYNNKHFYYQQRALHTKTPYGTLMQINTHTYNNLIKKVK